MEHRRALRTRTILQGRVVFNDRFSLIECTVRDLSDTGAQIAFAHPVTLPVEVELEIPTRKLSTRARVMWSKGKTHGLIFIAAAQAGSSSRSPTPLPGAEAVDTRPQEEQVTSSAPSIQDVLEEARIRIAQLAGVPAETVRLKLEIDFGAGAAPLAEPAPGRT